MTDAPNVQVLTIDPEEAVLSCKSCEHLHCRALLLRRLMSEGPYPYNFEEKGVWIDKLGKSITPD